MHIGLCSSLYVRLWWYLTQPIPKLASPETEPYICLPRAYQIPTMNKNIVGLCFPKLTSGTSTLGKESKSFEASKNHPLTNHDGL